MPKKKEVLQAQEWSFFLEVDDIEAEPHKFSIEANDKEKRFLEGRLGLVELKSLSADLEVWRENGMTIHVKGDFRAEIIQNCAVSMEPIDVSISEPVEGWFADKSRAVSFVKAKQNRQASKNHAEVEIMDESDDPEEIINGQIDLGELVTQHVSLAINPYLRKNNTGYNFGEMEEAEQGASKLRKNPFEKLKEWKENR